MTILSTLEIFGATLTAIGGYEGLKWLVKRFFPSKNEKRQDDCDTKRSEVDVEKSLVDLENNVHNMWKENMKAMASMDNERIKELREANAYLNNQNLEMLKDGARKDEIIADKVAKIRELEEQRVKDAQRIGQLLRQLDFFRSWHCEREYGNGKEDCKRRKPAQNPPIKYCPLSDIDINDKKDKDNGNDN